MASTGARVRSVSARRQATQVGIAMLAIAIGVGITFATIGGARPGWSTHVDRRLGLELQAPDGWPLQTFDNDLRLNNHRGVVISNVEHRFRYPDLSPHRSTSAWDMRALTDHTVAIEVSQLLRLNSPCRRDSTFPLTLHDAERAQPAFGSPPRLFISGCVEGGLHFGVHIWVWPGATSDDEEALREILESIQPAT